MWQLCIHNICVCVNQRCRNTAVLKLYLSLTPGRNVLKVFKGWNSGIKIAHATLANVPNKTYQKHSGLGFWMDSNKAILDI